MVRVVAGNRREPWRLQLEEAAADIAALEQISAQLEPLTKERLELGHLAGPRRRDEPGFRWLRYKEAYSPPLVRAVFDQWGEVDGPVLDPFAGSGTSILVALERGMPAVGVELLPYPQWAANTTVQARFADPVVFAQLVAGGLSGRKRPTAAGRQGVAAAPAAAWALTDEVAEALLTIQRNLPERGSSVEADLAHLALLSSVDVVSTAVKDGTSIRHRLPVREGRTRRPGRKGVYAGRDDVRSAFRAAAAVIFDDLPRIAGRGSASAQVVRGDARCLPLAAATVGGAVFSPPYPNRYDYSAIYQLELAVGGFVEDAAALRTVRKSLLRSHLEAPAPNSPAFPDGAVVSVLHAIIDAADASAADGGRTIRMLAGYFEDMTAVLFELARVLRPGAPAACVVATQTYFGVAVPTDVLLASLARGVGLEVEGVWVLRRKRVAVQQRARGRVDSVGGRESVLLLRRPS